MLPAALGCLKSEELSPQKKRQIKTRITRKELIIAKQSLSMEICPIAAGVDSGFPVETVRKAQLLSLSGNEPADLIHLLDGSLKLRELRLS